MALDALARDARDGLRRLVRDWRFTTTVVLILGLAAAFVPPRRAARMNPLVALRHE